MRFPEVVLTWALAGSLAGCGLGPQPEPSPSDPVAVEWPKGADELVLRIETRGGLLPPLERERQLPSISVYGDGLVLVPAPVDASFPGPAGYELQGFKIDADLLDDIVTAAVSIGLSGEDRHLAQEGPEFVADAGATTITVVTGSGHHVTSADALFETAEADTPARTQLRDFVERLFTLQPTEVGLAPHEPDAYRVFVAAPDPGFGAELPVAPLVAWPFSEPLADWGEALPADGLSVDVRCLVVPLTELADAFEVLRAVTSVTVVVDQAGEEAIVAYRPLLPDEEGCPAES
jgi:hypothetical protein